MVYEIEKTIDVAELFDELSDNEQKDFLVEKINDNFSTRNYMTLLLSA